MADQIEVQYDELQRIQDQLMNEANTIGQVRSSVGGQVDGLRQGVWMGDAATAFFTEMDNTVFPSMDRLQKALEFFATTVNQIKTTLSSAELSAAARFKSG